MLMNGQYGAMSPWSGFIGATNSLSGMMDNYNKMKMTQLYTNNYPQILQQNMLSTQLANQTNQTNLNYLANYDMLRNQGMGLSNQTAQTNLNYLPSILKNTLTSDQLNQMLTEAKLKQAQNPLANLSSPMGQALSDQQTIHKIYGDGSPQALAADAYVQKLNAIKSATNAAPNMVQLPNGAVVPAAAQPTQATAPLAAPLSPSLPVQTNVAPNAATVAPQQQSAATQGSVVPSMPTVAPQQQIAATTATAATGEQGQPVQVSAIGQNPNKTGGGVVYYNPATQQSFITPTRATISNAQAQLSALGVARSNIQDLYQNISPELGGYQGAINRTQGALGQILNIGDPTYEKYLAAKRNIPTTVDNVMKAMGLPKTNEVYQDLEKVMAPATFGTKTAYLRSISETLADLTLKDTTNNALLSQGFDLSGNKKLPSQSEIADKIYNELNTDQPASATGAPASATASEQAPYGKHQWSYAARAAYGAKNGMTIPQVDALIDQHDAQTAQGGQ
jgi:hypothetical protein